MNRGFTLVEVLVFLSLLLVFFLAAESLGRQTLVRSRQCAEHGGATRSAMLAIETVRSDVERMLFQCPSRDLALFENGGLSMRVPDGAEQPDLWAARVVPVTYSLRPIERSVAYHLERSSGNPPQVAVVGGCVLRDLQFKLISSYEPGSSRMSYLEVIARGMDEPGASVVLTLSELIPLPLMVSGGTYTLKPEED